jgi:hypothetical protein
MYLFDYDFSFASAYVLMLLSVFFLLLFMCVFFLDNYNNKKYINAYESLKLNINLIQGKTFLFIFQMADVIKSDIEKIERALNIRVDDVEIEVALNAGKYIVKLFSCFQNTMPICNNMSKEIINKL